MSSIVFTGTATGHYDLLTKVIAHLTSGAMGSQAWTLLKSVDDGADNYHDRYLKAPGLSGTDNIFINISSNRNIANDTFGWWIRGAIEFNTLNDWNNQPGTSPVIQMPLWDSTIPYWLIANGRRFILIAKVSTVYTSCYAGFIMPYATSSEMPYPLFIATNCNTTRRWSQGDFFTSGFWDPTEGSAYLRFWDGAWVEIANMLGRSDGRSPKTNNNIWPFQNQYGLGLNRDGSYGILPAIVHGNYSANNVYGELEGVFQVSGFSNAAEDTITIGADTYLVVQSVYRTGVRDYAAIKLG